MLLTSSVLEDRYSGRFPYFLSADSCMGGSSDVKGIKLMPPCYYNKKMDKKYLKQCSNLNYNPENPHNPANDVSGLKRWLIVTCIDNRYSYGQEMGVDNGAHDDLLHNSFLALSGLGGQDRTR
nr:hypothetical protein Iba_chr03aCG4200 [Ipomoea batatas]